MRYRLMASYLGAPYQAAVGPTDRDVTLFAAPPPPEEHGFSPDPGGTWRKQVRLEELDALWESRPIGSYHGEPCLVLDELGDRLHIVYLGMETKRAAQLGYWEVDRGVFEVVVPRYDVSDLAEERHEFPIPLLLSTLPPVGPQAPGGGGRSPAGTGEFGTGPSGAGFAAQGAGMPEWSAPAGTPQMGQPPAAAPAPMPAPMPGPPGTAGMSAPVTGAYSQPPVAPQGGAVPPPAPGMPGGQFPGGPQGAGLPGAPAGPPAAAGPGQNAQVPPAAQQPLGTGPLPMPTTQLPQPGPLPTAPQQFAPVASPPTAPQAMPAPQAAGMPQAGTQPGNGQAPQAPTTMAAWHGSPAADGNGQWYYQPAPAPQQGGAQPTGYAQGGQAPTGYVQQVPGPGQAPSPNGVSGGQQYAPGQPLPGQGGQPPQVPQPDQAAQVPQFAAPPTAPATAQPGITEPAMPGAPGANGSAAPPVGMPAPQAPAAGLGTPADVVAAPPTAQAGAVTAPLPAPAPPAPPPAAPQQQAEQQPVVSQPQSAAAAPPESPLTSAPAPSQSDQGISSGLTTTGPLGKRGRRAARKPRLSMSAVFADLVDMADIPRSAYAVDDEVTGAMCLFKTDGGYEVFSCTEDSRTEVRFFEEEESAYFYLFGVLAAEAVRNGRLSPRRG